MQPRATSRRDSTDPRPVARRRGPGRPRTPATHDNTTRATSATRCVPGCGQARLRYASDVTHIGQHLLSLAPILRDTPFAWLQGLIAAVAIFGASMLARHLGRAYDRRLRAAARADLVAMTFQVMSRTSSFFLVSMSIFFALQFFHWPARKRTAIDDTIVVVIFWQVGVWASAAISAWLEHRRRAQRADNLAATSSLGVIGFIGKAVVWTMVVLLALENLGVDITTLVAGLGVGGVAVALAMQSILGDLFASLSITFDQPFFVGDFITVDNFQGTVEHIGVKSTRLSSISGEQIVLSNSDLLKSRLRNYGRMHERRVLFTIGVTYETPVELLERIPQILRTIIEGIADTRFDRCHFSNHNSASLDFETVYYVLTADFKRHMDIQQEMRLKLHREFARLGIEFAYPTQRLIMERAGAPVAGHQAAPPG